MTQWAIVAFYGMDEVRFTAPTFIGDTLHVEAEVVEKVDKGERGAWCLGNRRSSTPGGRSKPWLSFGCLSLREGRLKRRADGPRWRFCGRVRSAGSLIVSRRR